MTDTRQRMSAAERRELVLDAAVTEFAVHGLAGTSTEDVARRAGISQPYLFRLFPTKKTLFVELVDRCYRRVEETFIAAAGDRMREEALEAMGNGYKRLLDDRTLLLLQMHVYAACDDPEIQAAARARYKHLWELIERLTGLPFQRVVEFFAMGMLMNVAATLDLPLIDEWWTSWCPKDGEDCPGHHATQYSWTEKLPRPPLTSPPSGSGYEIRHVIYGTRPNGGSQASPWQFNINRRP